mgnify:CR=1 FL=1
MKLMVAKDYSGIEIAKEKLQCCDCKKDILRGDRYSKHKALNKIKIRCLSCRQKILDSL